MRLAVLVAVVLASGCVSRRQEQCAVDSATFSQPPRIVYLAAVRAARSYFNGQVIHEDDPNGLSLTDREYWSGHLRITVRIIPVDDTHTRIDTEASARGVRNPPINDEQNGARRLRNYLTQVDLEVRSLTALAAPAAAAR